MGLGAKSIRINGAECGVEAMLLGAVTSLGGFLFGYDTGQISGMLLFRDFKDRFATGTDDNGDADWVSIIQSTMVSLMSIGTLLGALSASYTADMWGRRRSLSFGVLVFIIGNIIQITAMNSWIHMMMGRFVAGLGVGNLSVGVPMFQSECSPKEIRGAVVASYQLLITFGILISNLINFGVRNFEESDASWRIVIGLGIAFSVPLGLGVLVVPESPRWLAGRHDWEGARMSLARLRGLKSDPHHQLVEADIQEMYENIEKESNVGTGSWLECFTGGNGSTPKVVYRTLLGCAIHFMQQWTGVNYFFYYGATIFQSAGISDPIMVQLVLGAVNVFMTFGGLYVVEKFGRRLPLIFGGVWQGVWLAVFAAIGIALPPQENTVSGIVMIVAAALFIASFASTWGPGAWVVIAESFPLRTRAKQASLATASNWLGNFMISFLSPIADDGIGFGYGFVFMAVNFAAALTVYFFLYESRGLSLENVDRMYSEPGIKAWNSKKWVPPGYTSREQRDETAPSNRANDDAFARMENDKRKTSDDTAVGSHFEAPRSSHAKAETDNEIRV